MSVQPTTTGLIRLHDLAKTYRTGEVDVKAVRGITLEIERGEFTEYKGRTGLRKLASGIKARGRAHLFSRSTGHK